LLLAGGFLLIPGFVTDILGFILLVPYIRKKLAATIVFKGIIRAQAQSGFSSANSGYQTLDGEYERKDD